MDLDSLNKSFPLTLWQGSMSHFGFINIYQTGSSDRKVEQEVTKMFGYGQQLGRIVEALSVVVARLPREELSKLPREEQEMLQSFCSMATEIAKLKQKHIVLCPAPEEPANETQFEGGAGE